jgi:hypothetical protein
LTPRRVPYDLSGYKQIKFWGKLGPMAYPMTQLVQFMLPMLVETKVVDGGTCVATEIGTDKCSASYGRFIIFTGDWQLFTIDLIPRDAGMCGGTITGICQETWGKVFTWDPTNVVAIQFQAASDSTYDIWIDDIELVPQ